MLTSQQTPTPPTVSYLRQGTRTNNAAVVAEGGTKPTSLMGLERIDTVLKVVATLSEPVNRFWLSDSQSLQTWITQELTANVDVAIEALVFSTLGGTSGVQTQAAGTDGVETLRKALTKIQNVGGANPFVVMHPSDFEAISLLREASTNAFIAGSSAIQTVPGGAISAPYGPAALSSWGMPVALSIAATAKTAWVVAADAILLFVDGTVLVDWDSSSRFATNEVVGRAETRVYPAVVKPMSCVKVTLP
jgi:HK97 family phage major capsid protein